MKNRFFEALCCAAMLLGCAVQLQAASLFLSPSGIDAPGRGGIDAPFFSLAYASRQAEPGDTLQMRAGTYYYTSEQSINFQGAPRGWLTIRSYDGKWAAIIDGAQAALGSNESLVKFSGARHVRFDGIAARNSSQRGLSVYQAAYVHITNCRVANVQYRGIGGSGEYIQIKGNTVTGACKVNYRGALGSGGWPGAIASTTYYSTGARSRHWTISQNTVTNSWGEGIIAMNIDNATVSGNTVANAYSVSIYVLQAYNVKVFRNHLYFNKPIFQRDGRNTDGIKWAIEQTDADTLSQYGVDGLDIYNNLIVNCRRPFSWYQEGSTDYYSYRNVRIAHNTAYLVGDHGLFLYDCQGLTPIGNEFRNNLMEGDVDLGNSAPSWWTFSHNNWADGIPPAAAEPFSTADTPIFHDPSDEENPKAFGLMPESPCIAQAPLLAWVPKDYWGVTRTAPASLGFHELNANEGTRQAPSAAYTPRPLLAYPNPAHAGMQVAIPAPGTLRLYDAQGRMLYEQAHASAARVPVERPTAGAGLYVLEFSGHDGQRQTLRVAWQ